jgi:anti-anti-sigma factor
MEDTVEITCRREASLAIVDLSGGWSVSAGEREVVELQAVIAHLIAVGRVHVAFNLRGLATLDARALGEIAQTQKNLRRAGGELTLVAPNRFVRKMLAVTRLDSVIAVREAECDVPLPPIADISRTPIRARAGQALG